MSYELGKQFNTWVATYLKTKATPNMAAPFRNFAHFYTHMCKMFGHLRSKLPKNYQQYLQAWARWLCANSYPVIPSTTRIPPAFVEEEYLSRRYYATFVLPIQYCTPDNDMFASFEQRYVPAIGANRCYVTPLKNPRASQRSCANAFHEPQWMSERAFKYTNPKDQAFAKQMDAPDIKAANDQFSEVMFSSKGGRGKKK